MNPIYYRKVRVEFLIFFCIRSIRLTTVALCLNACSLVIENSKQNERHQKSTY